MCNYNSGTLVHLRDDLPLPLNTGAPETDCRSFSWQVKHWGKTTYFILNTRITLFVEFLPKQRRLWKCEPLWKFGPLLTGRILETQSLSILSPVLISQRIVLGKKNKKRFSVRLWKTVEGKHQRPSQDTKLSEKSNFLPRNYVTYIVC